jgi:protoheme IX farnesyltransferase
MNMTIWTVADRRGSVISRMSDFGELCKLRISVLVLITVALSAVAASWGHPDLITVVHTLIGTALIAFSASAWNQWLERDVDAKMERTATRPLPATRLNSWEVLSFGTLLMLVGLVYLRFLVNPLTAGFGLATWVVYVVFYTPLKRITSWNTLVGAIAGAMPVLIGWSAVGNLRNDGLLAAAFFLIVFLWQFPHFMAIAWIYREQYAHAKLQMTTVTDPSGLRAGLQAVLGALALLLVSIVPVIVAPRAAALMIAVFTLGTMQLICAISFLRHRNETAARRLLRATIVYLPITLLLLAMFPVI